ncbi:MAG: orotidine-5'-phosphate decarboxylase [Acidobacteria bacterium]|nr:orotidine-5'-phosphate decarboxylase [Acidobacteriota bacterium]
MELQSKPKAGSAHSAPAFSLEEARERMIVALDVPNREAALEMVRRLEGEARWVKVGLELYLAAGRGVIDDLREAGLEVFLDLKLHDIPNTVAGAVRSVAGCGASLLTLHASGGPTMLRAAVEAAAGLPVAPKLLAVTVLTSMNAADLAATGVQVSAAEQVMRLGTMAVGAGVDGLVCSPEETAALRGALPSALLVVPGIRNAEDTMGDQSRTASAAETLRRGASYLVIGRPITAATEPGAALRGILDSVVSF